MSIDTVSSRVASWAILLSLTASGCSNLPRLADVSPHGAPTSHILFRDVSVFDGVRLVPHRDVLVTGVEIAAVTETGVSTPPPDTLELSGTGRTLLPGLVDSHVHLMTAGQKDGVPPDADAIARAFLFAGVTTVLVAAGYAETTELRQRQRSGEALAPHLYTAGPGLSAPDGHPLPLLRASLPWPARWFATRDVPTAADGYEARTHVTRIVADDRPDFLKIVYDDLPPGSPHMSLEALQAAIAESRARGVRAIVHATTPRDAIEAIETGAAMLVHVPQRGVLSDTDVARIVNSGIPVVTTARLVSASHALAANGPSALERQMYDRALLQPWLDEPRWELAGFSEEIDRRQTEAAAETAANVRALIASGARLLVGTDSGVHGVFPGASIHLEMEMLVELGMSPVEVLTAATSAPAAFLDPGRRFGRIAPGYVADLLLVRGDPTVNIAALSNIDEVVVGGVRLDRAPVAD